MVTKIVKSLFNLFNISISRITNETEVPIEVLIPFIASLQPQIVTKLTRVGSSNDGGYVVPENLGNTTKLFSPGCDGIVEFERDLYKKYKIPSIVLDEIIKKPEPLDSFIDFQENWLDATTREGTISLTDWVKRNATPSEDLILQMDIEGSEYEVIRNTSPEILGQFHTIVIEFHYFEMIKNSYLFETKVKPTFDALFRNHVPVFLNPNNCCGEVKFEKYQFPRVFEITLIRKSELLNVSELDFKEVPTYVNIPENNSISIKWEDFAGE